MRKQNNFHNNTKKIICLVDFVDIYTDGKKKKKALMDKTAGTLAGITDYT